MENRKKKVTVLLLMAVLFCVSCSKLDPTGFLYSTVPVNERVKQSLEWNNLNTSRDIEVSGTDYNLLVAGDSHVGTTVNLDALFARANMPGISGLVSNPGLFVCPGPMMGLYL